MEPPRADFPPPPTDAANGHELVISWVPGDGAAISISRVALDDIPLALASVYEASPVVLRCPKAEVGHVTVDWAIVTATRVEFIMIILVNPATFAIQGVGEAINFGPGSTWSARVTVPCP